MAWLLGLAFASACGRKSDSDVKHLKPDDGPASPQIELNVKVVNVTDFGKTRKAIVDALVAEGGREGWKEVLGQDALYVELPAAPLGAQKAKLMGLRPVIGRAAQIRDFEIEADPVPDKYTSVEGRVLVALFGKVAPSR